MKNKISHLVRLGHQHQTTTVLLGEQVTALQGVSLSAADVLSEVGIRTIFDLASSRLLDGAADANTSCVGKNGRLSSLRSGFA